MVIQQLRNSVSIIIVRCLFSVFFSEVEKKNFAPFEIYILWGYPRLIGMVFLASFSEVMDKIIGSAAE